MEWVSTCSTISSHALGWATIIKSSNHRKINCFSPDLMRTNNAGSYPARWKSILLSSYLSFKCHSRPACLSPYKDFFRRQTLSVPSFSIGGCSTYTVSCNPRCRNAVEVSMWRIGRLSVSACINSTRNVACCPVGAHTWCSKKSTPSTWS